jgi:glutamate synthase (ferredoxin)
MLWNCWCWADVPAARDDDDDPGAVVGHESMSDEKQGLLRVSLVLDGALGRPGVSGVHGWNCDRRLPRSQRSAAVAFLRHHDDLVVMASEAGVLDIAPERIKQKGRLQPGRMFLIDTEQGRIISDEEIKESIVQGQKPYRQWINDMVLKLPDVPDGGTSAETTTSVLQRQQAFGYTFEDLRILMVPMARDGVEAIGSMGTDTPLAVLSDKPQLLFNYFKQLFAQVTNPPIDCIREEIITARGNDDWAPSGTCSARSAPAVI